MAIACLRLFTLPPLPPFPERRVPLFLRRIALATVFPAALLYLRRLDFFFVGMCFLSGYLISDESPCQKVAAAVPLSGVPRCCETWVFAQPTKSPKALVRRRVGHPSLKLRAG